GPGGRRRGVVPRPGEVGPAGGQPKAGRRVCRRDRRSPVRRGDGPRVRADQGSAPTEGAAAAGERHLDRRNRLAARTGAGDPRRPLPNSRRACNGVLV
ncbi:MAG: hypothetical protein AVDCRST_MAG64-94, partial [uncultured Phycisphaerae bacterium]